MRSGWSMRLRGRVPGVELDHVHLRRRDQRVGACRPRAAPRARARAPGRARVRPGMLRLGMLLEEQLAGDALGRAHQRHRPVRRGAAGSTRRRSRSSAPGRAWSGRSTGRSRARGCVTLMLPAVPPRAPRPRRRGCGPRATSRVTVARRLVGAQALERRMADVAVGRPLGERDLGDELGLDPALAAGGAPRPAPGLERLGGERRLGDLELRQPRVQVAPGPARSSRCRRCRRSCSAPSS